MKIDYCLNDPNNVWKHFTDCSGNNQELIPTTLFSLHTEMGNLLLILGECELRLEHFNFRFLSGEFHRQPDLPPAQSFSNLQLWSYFKNEICEEQKLCCTLRDTINSDAWSKSVCELYYLSKVTVTQISVVLAYWLDGQIFHLLLGKSLCLGYLG